MRRLICAMMLICCAVGRADEPSFELDVMPILSKAGCNGGGCHGAIAGKAGFRLSLFGYDPESDYRTITRDARGRRIDFADPGTSLLLTKPTMALPHKGGKRLDVGGDDYKLLAAWIEAGCPGPKADEKKLAGVDLAPVETAAAPGQKVTFTVTARYSDGSTRDVTRWARFTSADETVATVDTNGNATVVGHGAGAVTAWFSSKIAVANLIAPFPHSVSPADYAAAPRANVIDELNLAQLEQLHLKPSPPCDEATFLRRAFLDTIGRLPTPEEVREYLADRSPAKKERLVSLLLARPEFVDYWAYKWSDVLLVTGAKLRPAAVDAYSRWIRDRVAENVPWDRFVREVVAARGSSIENGATNFFAVHQDPETVAENVAQAFLALSINCAKCHNHPLEKWTNDQYYAFANLFARVRAKGWGGEARSGDGQRTLFVEAKGDLLQPKTGKPQPPAPLDGEPLPMDDAGDRREPLATWLTSPDNPYFTRAIVNRVWANFFGIGLVEPVDDLRSTNPASNEKLLAALSGFTIEHGYDLKALMRLILLSETYARSSVPLPENRDDRRWFARAYPKRLMAEVLSDAISDVTGVRDRYTETMLADGSTEKIVAYDAGTRALELRDSTVKNYFLKTFGRNAREITCECERSSQPSLVQVLHLSNGSTLNDKLAAKEGRVTQILATDPAPAQLVEDAWLVALSRKPTDAERKPIEEMLTKAPAEEKRQIVEDMYWSLLTSREFLFRH
ncbi:MAG: DUF1553 domain-containing protein [Planctomycetia bacterium]|nr:DUF1553 domain-containing protein [Planctomycetia bacterium]